MNDASIEPIKTANLLLVDDEPNVLKALNRLFRSDHYTIHMAENGAEGLEILKREAIDLIISDMRMPQMDGAEFLAKAAEQWPDTIRILLTGFADLESTIAAVNDGKIYNYCSKPWEDHELKILVSNALDQKRLRDERQQLFQIINQQNAELKNLNTCLEEKVEQRTHQLKKSLQCIDQAHNALKKQYTDSIKAFAKIIEMRPGIKSGRAKYIADGARKVAQHLGMSNADARNVLYAGLLLQIGKMSLPDELLVQPYYSMSYADKKRYLQHALEGRTLLKGIEQLKDASELIFHQYENYDGSGFPNALTGHEIPLGSRILAVVRDYVSYLDGSITGESMPIEQVKSHLSAKKGYNYDPDVVDTFLNILSNAEPENSRPIIELSWTQLQPGMEIAEISCNDILYLKDRILTQKIIDEILTLREHGSHLSIKVRLGEKRDTI
ncbi:MAG: HD domain-containing phosphohydrolase [Gammaproteobacteria bacterium]